MSIAEANLQLPPNFTGVVKLFPLPNLVLFPGVIQPLHIFEPRYRKLLEDAIGSDQLIAMAKLKPDTSDSVGSETDEPDVHQTICVGKIITHAELPDGRFNLLILGAQRARIIRELATDLPYRLADVKVVDSTKAATHLPDEPVRDKVIDLFQQLVALDRELDAETIGHLLNDGLPLGLLLDMLTFSCGASLRDQQDILETCDVMERGDKVLEILQSRLASTKQSSQLRFPPAFSYN